MKPENLEKKSFLWSQVRLLLAAIAMFLGGSPLVYKLFSGMSFSSQVSALLNDAWIISGIAALYLFYRWREGGMKLFGKRDIKDTIAFYVLTVSGFNLGIMGVLGINVGMKLAQRSPSYSTLLILTGIVYLVVMVYLHMRWMQNNKRVF